MKAKFEVNAEIMALLDTLKPAFNVATTADLLRKAVSLAIVAGLCAGEDGRVDIVGDRANRTLNLKA